jgi:hypothetical protein
MSAASPHNPPDVFPKNIKIDDSNKARVPNQEVPGSNYHLINLTTILSLCRSFLVI